MPTTQLGAVVHDRARHTGGTVLDGHTPSIAAGFERVEACLAALIVLVKKPKVVAAQTALLVALDPVAMDDKHVRFAAMRPLPPKLAVWKATLVERARDQSQPCAVDAQRAIERVLLFEPLARRGLQGQVGQPRLEEREHAWRGARDVEAAVDAVPRVGLESMLGSGLANPNPNPNLNANPNPNPNPNPNLEEHVGAGVARLRQVRPRVSQPHDVQVTIDHRVPATEQPV